VEALGTSIDVILQEYPMAVIDAGLKTLIVPISSLQDEITILPDINVLKEFVINSDIDIILLFSKETSDHNY
jgi:predicted PhzF superfamily epimerase YddE/YHI9